MSKPRRNYELADMRLMAGFNSRPKAAEYFGISPRTWARYELDGQRVPVAVLRCLRMLTGFDLGEFHEAWRGWGICPKTGDLFSPNREFFTPGGVQSLFFLRQLQQHVRAQMRAEARQHDRAEATQPLDLKETA